MLIGGNCLDILKTYEDNKFDLIVTDPPYGISFMGKDWDKALPKQEVWQQCYRVLKEDKIADRLKFEETELDEAIKTQKLQSIEIADQNAKAFQQNLKNPQKGNTPFGRKPGSGSSNSSQDSSKQQ